jgi:tRNA A37 threonylcarbamoyladenosine synthetase subunit TsaC/SUA5/YrdC
LTDEDPLLDEISQTLKETEKTSPKIAPKLANIINKWWLNKLTDDQLKEKQNKTFALKIANASLCQKLIQKSGANLTALQEGVIYN